MQSRRDVMSDSEIPPAPGGKIAAAMASIETRLSLMEGREGPLSEDVKRMIAYYLLAFFSDGQRSQEDRIFELEQSARIKDRRIEKLAEELRATLIEASDLRRQLRKYQQ